MRPSTLLPFGPCIENARRVQTHVGTRLARAVTVPFPGAFFAKDLTLGQRQTQAFAGGFGGSLHRWIRRGECPPASSARSARPPCRSSLESPPASGHFLGPRRQPLRRQMQRNIPGEESPLALLAMVVGMPKTNIAHQADERFGAMIDKPRIILTMHGQVMLDPWYPFFSARSERFRWRGLRAG